MIEFLDKKVNTGRQKEFDIAKGLSIIFMILAHVLIFTSLFPNAISPEYNLIFNRMAKIFAPVFMFCMGIGIIYSRHSQHNLLIKRGVKLLLLGYFVNIGELIIPYALAHMLNINYYPITALSLFYVDILVFAGLAFILIGILKKFKFSKEKMLILAIAFSIIGSFLRFIDFNNLFLNFFMGNFIGTLPFQCTVFPLFNWFIFPITGLFYGSYFIRAKYKSQFFSLWPVFLICSLVFIYYNMSKSGAYLYDDAHAYFITFLDAIVIIIFIHGFLGFCWKISEFLPNMLINGFDFLSKHINGIYIAQWYFIPSFIILLEYFYKGFIFTDLSIILISIFILIISILVVLYIKKLNQQNRTLF